jgi:hypothetical protein
MRRMKLRLSQGGHRTLAASRGKPPAIVVKAEGLRMDAVDYRQPPAKKLLVATALLTRDHATVVPFDCGGYHATALSRANGDTARADSNSDV